MQSNKTFTLEKQNHTPKKHHQHHQWQQQQHQQPLLPKPANGQQASSQNVGLTVDLKNFRKPEEKIFTQYSLPFVGNLSPDITEEEMRTLFEKYGKQVFDKLKEAFSGFGQPERAVVIVDDRGRPSGKDIIEFSGKPTARKALDRCSKGSLLTTFLQPVTVEPMDRLDDKEGLPEELVIKTK